jgi:hypothetical protein
MFAVLVGRHSFPVQDPFELNRDLSDVVSQFNSIKIKKEFIRAVGIMDKYIKKKYVEFDPGYFVELFEKNNQVINIVDEIFEAD